MAQPSTLNEISQIILSKERELHQFHDLRCGQLEALVEERDQLLLESSRRFEKLKDDFEYNLALIQARDVEIERLEHELKTIQTELAHLNDDKKHLIAQLEAAQSRESELVKKSELDRINNKKYVEEVKDIIAQMEWSADEEARAKDREVESLRNDIRRLNTLRDESLESQRRDLTNTFEGILQQREQIHENKEREIADQIAQVSMRLELLQTENTRLKNEVAGAQRQCEHLAEELSHKEEARRQLQWNLDDERAARTQADSTAAHQLQQVTLELSLHKENAAKDIADLKRKLAQSKEEGVRDKEVRTALEQRLEEVRRSALLDLTSLENEVQEHSQLEARQQREIASLREERDDALQRAAAVKVEADSADLRLSNLTVDYDSLAQELHSTRERLHEADAQLSKVQREYQDYRCQMGDKENDSLQHVTQQLVEAKTSHLSEMTLLKRAHAEEISKLKAQLEEEALLRVDGVSARHDADMLSVQRQLADTSSELEMARATLQTRMTELEEERRECAALKLRLAVHEGQPKPAQAARGTGAAQNNPYNANLGAAATPYDLQLSPNESYMQPARGIGMTAHSPMFSEDLGDVSLSFPNSPVNTSVRAYPPQPVRLSGDFNGTDYSAYRRDAPREAFGTWSDTAGFVQQPAVDTKLKEENEWLKSVVKEMREEVEKLQLQNGSTSTGKPQQQPQQEQKSEGPSSHLSRPATKKASHRNNHRSEDPSWFDEASQDSSSEISPRDSRSHSDTLHLQSSRASLDAEDRQKFGLLEAQNQRLVDELVRLRQERLSVMDVGNKLRSALNKHVTAPESGADDEMQVQQAQHLVQEVDRVRDWLTAPAHSSTRAAGPFGTGSGAENDDFLEDEGLSGAEKEMLRRNRARYHEELYREQQQRERREREHRQQQKRAEEEYSHSRRGASRSTSRSRRDRDYDRDHDHDEEGDRNSRSGDGRGSSRDRRHHREGSRHRSGSESRERVRERDRDNGRSTGRDKNKKREPAVGAARTSRDSAAGRYRNSYQSDEEQNEEVEHEYSPEEKTTSKGHNNSIRDRAYDTQASDEASDFSPADTKAGAGKGPEQYTSAGHRVWGSGSLGSGVRGNNVRPSSHPSQHGQRGPPQAPGPTDIKLHGQSLIGANSNSTYGSVIASQGVDTALLTNSHKPPKASVAGTLEGNLLTAASQAAPRSTLSNSKRMTPSQQEALKRIQESKKRNSMFVGGVQGASATTGGAASAAAQPTRKVINYASYLNSSEA